MEKIEFRDGERWVPVHVAHLLNIAGVDTHTLTYEQALKVANQGLLVRRLNDAQQSAIKSHFRR